MDYPRTEESKNVDAVPATMTDSRLAHSSGRRIEIQNNRGITHGQCFSPDGSACGNISAQTTNRRGQYFSPYASTWGNISAQTVPLEAIFQRTEQTRGGNISAQTLPHGAIFQPRRFRLRHYFSPQNKQETAIFQPRRSWPLCNIPAETVRQYFSPWPLGNISATQQQTGQPFSPELYAWGNIAAQQGYG